MEKEITISEFAKELSNRITSAKTIDCCKEEIMRLAEMAKNHMGDQKIKVTWKD